jgi:small-conductance mechanosensitive channel
MVLPRHLTWDLLMEEFKNGGPHVHFVAFILFNILGILVLHYVFRWLIDFLSKHTRGSREAWAGAFRFLPVLLGMQLGIKLTKDILDLPKFVRHILNQHFHSLVIFTVTLFTAHLIAAYLKSRLSKSEERSSSMSILATVVDIGVYMVGFLFILNSYGISISPLLTALGAGGLASALALQDTLANLFSGITTIFSKQVRMGDYIKLASGESGRVVDMNWRNTTIRTATGNMIIVPNKNIAASNLTNYEQPLAECTITIPITITYDNDLQKVGGRNPGSGPVCAGQKCLRGHRVPAPGALRPAGRLRHPVPGGAADQEYPGRSRPPASVHQTDLQPVPAGRNRPAGET